MSLQEISALMDTSKQAVSQIKDRALVALANLLFKRLARVMPEPSKKEMA